jgi:hypothetical protein
MKLKPSELRIPPLPVAHPRSDRLRSGGRESNFLSISAHAPTTAFPLHCGPALLSLRSLGRATSTAIAALLLAVPAFILPTSAQVPNTLKHTITAPGPTDGLFGYSVAVSGTLMVVGAWMDDTGASNAGRAYVYDLSSGTPTVPVATLNNPSPAVDDVFGLSVAISGTRVAVGSFRHDTGATDAGSAYVFDLSSATPTVPIATLNNPSPMASDYFGISVAISGTRVVVGASADDTGATDTGSAYVFDLSSATPTVPIATLNNPSPALDDAFGEHIAISGTRVVVGAQSDNTGSPAAGSAYVYDLSSGTPTVPVTTLNNPSPAVSDQFGNSVAIDGTRVVIGTPYDFEGAGAAGSAYVYDLNSGTPTVPVATLNNPGPAYGDVFGYSVAISGTRVVVGAYQDDTGAPDAGSAYVYDLSSGTPTVPVGTLNNPSPAESDLFGLSVAIDGTTVAIGAPSEDAVYVFGPVPEPSSTLLILGGAALLSLRRRGGAPV